MTANYAEGSTAAPVGGGVGGSSAGAKEQAKQAAGTAAEESRHVAGVAQEEAGKVAAEASSQVRGLVGQAVSQVEEQSRTQLGRLAELLGSYGDDLGRMASSGEGPAAGLAQEAADRVKGLSSQLSGREPGDLLDELRRFARRRPGLFLGSALAAGVVAGRLTRGAKAAHDDQAPTHAGGQSSYDAAYEAPYDSQGYSPEYLSRASDVTSPGDPLSTGRAAGSSGSVSDPSTQAYGTASGDPLAGVGTPETEPVYPGGSQDGLR
jgi:hypothetical protein